MQNLDRQFDIKTNSLVSARRLVSAVKENSDLCTSRFLPPKPKNFDGGARTNLKSIGNRTINSP